MIARLGEVLYGIAYLIALPIVVFAAYTIGTGSGGGYPITAMVFAGFVYLIGRVCRFILSGR